VARGVPRGVDEIVDEAGDTVGVGCPVIETAVEKVVPAAELSAEAAPTADRIAREDTERILCYKRVTRSEKVVENVVDLDMTGIEGIASSFISPDGDYPFVDLYSRFTRPP
jgi:hypothetical protein